MPTGSSRPHTYFAATNKADIGHALRDKLVECVNDNVNTLREEYASAYRMAYGRDMGFGITTGITREGEQGELANLRVNISKSVAKAYIAMVTAPGVQWKATARNADVGAQAAASLGTHILEDEWKNRGLAVHYLSLVEIACLFSEAFSFPEWDRSLGPVVGLKPVLDDEGRQVMRDDGKPAMRPVRGGDINYHRILPWDAFRDNRAKEYLDLNWLFLRIYKNRWDLAELHPTMTNGKPSRELIIASKENEMLRALDVGQRGIGEKTDFVPCWYFFHKPSPALPTGRQVIFLNDECVLEDKALRYCDPGEPEIPVVRLAADEMYDTAHGWTPYWDTLGPQEAIDSLETSITTNETNFGVQNIWYEKGTEIHAQDLALGVRAMEIPKGARPPGAVQLVQSPKESFDHIKVLKADIRQLMGLNDAAMGQPESAQMNAQAFAVLVSMAIQQASPFQKRCLEALQTLGTMALKLKRARVTQERIIEVVGESESALFAQEKYSGAQLKPFSRTVVEIGNPMQSTDAGRALIFQTLASAGIVKNAEELQQVVETGRIEPATRGLRDELMMVQGEYQQLAKGMDCPVDVHQNHALHYRENNSVLFSPDALNDANVINAVHNHLDQHYEMYFGVAPAADPQRLDRERFLLGQGPLPPPMPPPGPPGGPGAGPPPPGPMAGPPGPLPGHPGGHPGVVPPKPGKQMSSAIEAMTPPNGASPPQLPMPAMPLNPVSGQKFNPSDGGIR